MEDKTISPAAAGIEAGPHKHLPNDPLAELAEQLGMRILLDISQMHVSRRAL